MHPVEERSLLGEQALRGGELQYDRYTWIGVELTSVTTVVNVAGCPRTERSITLTVAVGIDSLVAESPRTWRNSARLSHSVDIIADVLKDNNTIHKIS